MAIYFFWSVIVLPPVNVIRNGLSVYYILLLLKITDAPIRHATTAEPIRRATADTSIRNSLA